MVKFFRTKVMKIKRFVLKNCVASTIIQLCFFTLIYGKNIGKKDEIEQSRCSKMVDDSKRRAKTLTLRSFKE